MNEQMNEQRTLCHRCAAAYRDAGYYIRRDYNATVKDSCDICGRMGWQFWIAVEERNHANKTM